MWAGFAIFLSMFTTFPGYELPFGAPAFSYALAAIFIEYRCQRFCDGRLAKYTLVIPPHALNFLAGLISCAFYAGTIAVQTNSG